MILAPVAGSVHPLDYADDPAFAMAAAAVVPEFKLLEQERAAAPLRQLIGGRRPDGPGADHNRIELLSHTCSPPEAYAAALPEPTSPQANER